MLFKDKVATCSMNYNNITSRWLSLIAPCLCRLVLKTAVVMTKALGSQNKISLVTRECGSNKRFIILYQLSIIIYFYCMQN